jgi:hypothetical protein
MEDLFKGRTKCPVKQDDPDRLTDSINSCGKHPRTRVYRVTRSDGTRRFTVYDDPVSVKVPADCERVLDYAMDSGTKVMAFECAAASKMDDFFDKFFK